MGTWDGFPVEQTFVASGDLNIAVGTAGSGPDVVLIHGITSRGSTWIPVLEALASEFHLIILDQRGHGDSSKPEHGYLLPDYVGDLEAVLAAFGLDRPVIVGHSLGGMVTLEWAVAHPDSARALVIEDSPMFRGGPQIPEMFGGWLALRNLSLDEAIAHFASEHPDWPDDLVRRRAVNSTTVAPGVLTDLQAEMMTMGGVLATSAYTGIQSPALLLYGGVEAGGMVPEAHAQAFVDALPHAEKLHIPEAPHNIHELRTDDFLAAVLPFLREHAG